jgi:hypothetical protein
MCFSIIEKSL